MIDLRPGPGYGRLGTTVHDDSGNFEDGWPSLTAYLGAVADALSHGGGVDGWYHISPTTKNCGGIWDRTSPPSMETL